MNKEYRPWTLSEVPVGRIIRYKDADGYKSMILAVSPFSICTTGDLANRVSPENGKSCQEMFDGFEQSSDNGETWYPCGIEKQ